MFRLIYQIILVGLCSMLFGFAYNTFLIPHKLSSGGVTGIAFFIHHFLHVNTGLIVLMINIPLFILAVIFLGKRFVCFTIYSVVVLSFSLKVIPIHAISNDILLSSIIGGALYGIAVGLIIRIGGSTGGTDIVSLILSQKRNIQVGFLSACINLLVVGASGLIFGWNITLYTIIAIYVAGRAVDMVYTTQNKLTLRIVTEKGDELTEALIRLHSRGITVNSAEGAYTHNPKKVLTTVITRFELNETKHTIKMIDPHAFVNISQTLEVMGRFRKN
ncbi:YitT family protein [Heyndrickxia ginsengihumi]|uniref:YitT family protein n=1 Tax=Heyndrickxia ginsengihumi TaxID=363870 RepID=UPI000685EF84|nr:YitT family protein [Heyndrickxia ginsengihumi]MCM3024405.1 YitT family protein [Heyndrickxia ginsengihumi]